MSEKANDYANALLDKLAAAKTDAEIVAICKETQAAVEKLQAVHPARFHHVVNLVKLRRLDFKRAHRREREQENQQQQDMFR